MCQERHMCDLSVKIRRERKGAEKLLFKNNGCIFCKFNENPHPPMQKEPQRSWNKNIQRKLYQNTLESNCRKIKDKKKIFKESREKYSLQGNKHKNNFWLLSRNNPSQRLWITFLNCWKRKKQNKTLSTKNSIFSKNLLQNWRWNKDIFRKTKVEKIHSQQIHTTRNTKGSSSDWREIIPEGKTDLQK